MIKTFRPCYFYQESSWSLVDLRTFLCLRGSYETPKFAKEHLKNIFGWYDIQCSYLLYETGHSSEK